MEGNRFFDRIIATVMKHNDYADDMKTVEACNKRDFWTPCDLIIREYLNNDGDSAPGFLGITRRECIEAYDYIKKNAPALIKKDMISKEGYNNFGFPLWDNYDF